MTDNRISCIREWIDKKGEEHEAYRVSLYDIYMKLYDNPIEKMPDKIKDLLNYSGKEELLWNVWVYVELYNNSESEYEGLYMKRKKVLKRINVKGKDVLREITSKDDIKSIKILGNEDKKGDYVAVLDYREGCPIFFDLDIKSGNITKSSLKVERDDYSILLVSLLGIDIPEEVPKEFRKVYIYNRLRDSYYYPKVDVYHWEMDEGLEVEFRNREGREYSDRYVYSVEKRGFVKKSNLIKVDIPEQVGSFCEVYTNGVNRYWDEGKLYMFDWELKDGLEVVFESKKKPDGSNFKKTCEYSEEKKRLVRIIKLLPEVEGGLVKKPKKNKKKEPKSTCTIL